MHTVVQTSTCFSYPVPSPSSALAGRPLHADKTRSHRTWRGVVAELVDVGPSGIWKEPFPAGTLRVTAVLGFAGSAIEMRLAPDRPVRGGRTRRGQLNILPPEIPAWEHADGILHLRRLALHFDIASICVATGLSPSFAASPLLMFEDSRILDLAGLLADECEAAVPLGALYAECVVAALISAVQACVGAPTPENIGGLTARHLKQVEAFVEASLSGQIQLHELAALTGFSESHFCRAFKTSTGLSPHRWVQERRIRHAQALIVAAALPLAQIALESGFADQGHLTRVFRVVTGTTPAAWRRKTLHRRATANAA